MNNKLRQITYWHIWKGCKKVSPACKNCFIKNFDTVELFNPICPERPYGTIIIPCIHSDFFIEEADQWREDVWKQIKKNNHLIYLIITKRVERIKDCLPDDWGDGYDNVILSCTVETQEIAHKRIPEFLEIPCKHRWLSCCPLIEELNLTDYLSTKLIEHIECCGEIGDPDIIRPTYYEWVEDLFNQCKTYNIRFSFMKIGHKFIKDGETYLERAICYHSKMADACNLNYYKPLYFILDNKEFILE